MRKRYTFGDDPGCRCGKGDGSRRFCSDCATNATSLSVDAVFANVYIGQ